MRSTAIDARACGTMDRARRERAMGVRMDIVTSRERSGRRGGGTGGDDARRSRAGARIGRARSATDGRWIRSRRAVEGSRSLRAM